IPTLEELRSQHTAQMEPVVEGNEAWAIKKEISQVGEWEIVEVKPPVVTEKKQKEESRDTHSLQLEDDDEDEENLSGYKLKEKEYPTDTVIEEETDEVKPTIDGWLGVLLSSTACILGASILYLDKFCRESFLDSRSFMASSMALASGVLLFSSLAILFPEAKDRLNNNSLLYLFYFSGAIFTLLLTRLVHYLMPDAIHACGDAVEVCQHEEEQSKLNKPCDVEYGTIKSSESHFRFHHDDLVHQPSSESVAESTSSHHHDNHHHHHHHHESVEVTVHNDPNHYYSIGIQTAIAIGVHKFPEGLVMFVSSQASTSLGLSVCIAMSIHNLTEGFMIALPLYYATRSRMTAFTYASIMGGLSQPLGALIGITLLKHIDKKSEDLMFGIIFATSMLPQAIRADSHQHYVLIFFFLGIFLVGLSSIL
ncbi:ZIP zinc transporter-domain-containing protein, partial [Pilobolus umbonatus]